MQQLQEKQGYTWPLICGAFLPLRNEPPSVPWSASTPTHTHPRLLAHQLWPFALGSAAVLQQLRPPSATMHIVWGEERLTHALARESLRSGRWRTVLKEGLQG